MANDDGVTFPQPQWTPINAPSTPRPVSTDSGNTTPTSTPTKKLPIRQQTPFIGSAASSNKADPNFSDEEILRDITLLKGRTLLQVAGTHTSKEIVRKVNANYSRAVLTNKSLSRSLMRSLSSVAEEQRREREEVKQELEATRKANGVNARRHAAAGVASVAAKRAKAEKLKFMGTSSPMSSNAGFGVDDESMLGGDANEDEEVRNRKAELLKCKRLLQGDRLLLVNHNLLHVAAYFTHAEIAAKAPALSHHQISERLRRALTNVAREDGKTREGLRSELDKARSANGVIDRQNVYGQERRAASMDAKRAKFGRAGTDGYQHPIDVGGVMDNEDPLRDLREMGRRTLEGDLAEEDERGDDQVNRSYKVTPPPKPFNSSFVGYKVDEPPLFVPGFRTY